MNVALRSGASPRDVGFQTRCSRCRQTLGPGFLPMCPECGGIAEVEYDLAAVELRDSANPYVRFRDLLPVVDDGLLPDDAEFSPTIHATALGEALGMPWLYLKDETRLPTGTTKDRMAPVALAFLREHGVEAFATSSTGNTSTAYRHAISSVPGLVMYLFTAERFRDRVQASGDGQVVDFILRDATFVEAFDHARRFAEENGLAPERGFFNPARREGLKLAWLEAAEQVQRPIDWYVQAVSSAMGVVGVYKGAKELRALGRADRLPRLLCVQQETCAPMVSAWKDGSDRIRPEHVVARPEGIADAILRGNPTAAYPHVHDIVVESRGTFEAVSEREIRQARELVEDLEGVSPCFSAAAALAGLLKSRRLGEVPSEDTVLVNLTGRDRQERASISDARWLVRSNGDWVPEDSAGG
jgi:threonine synthase